MSRPLLMIPGPIEISAGVRDAAGLAPMSHVAPEFIADFGDSLRMMREVWCASAESQPFILAGSGTLAMEMAVANLVETGDDVLVLNTGYFSDRMAEMLRRRGAVVSELTAAVGGQVAFDDFLAALAKAPKLKAVFATHVDTSTGVRIDAKSIALECQTRGILTVFDGVCATAGEEFRMSAWGADVYLTASQKAIGLPPGLALMVASPKALVARRALTQKPPLGLDFESWLPIMKAYEGGKGSYFATPATTLVAALKVGLDEILAKGIDQRFDLHRQRADTMRSCWRSMGLRLVVDDAALASNLLSAIYYPEGVDSKLVGRVAAKGVSIAGGLHPEIKDRYFRVGHMGEVLGRPQDLQHCVTAIAQSLAECGHLLDPQTAMTAFDT